MYMHMHMHTCHMCNMHSKFAWVRSGEGWERVGGDQERRQEARGIAEGAGRISRRRLTVYVELSERDEGRSDVLHATLVLPHKPAAGAVARRQRSTIRAVP